MDKNLIVILVAVVSVISAAITMSWIERIRDREAIQQAYEECLRTNERMAKFAAEKDSQNLRFTHLVACNWGR